MWTPKLCRCERGLLYIPTTSRSILQADLSHKPIHLTSQESYKPGFSSLESRGFIIELLTSQSEMKPYTGKCDIVSIYFESVKYIYFCVCYKCDIVSLFILNK